MLSYGMSEMAGQFAMCEHGYYHCPPWIIPFVLDPDTARPSPRHGTITGRFAFYDLLPDTRWGGFVSGDEVTMSWDPPCACGRTGAYVHPNISRLSDKRTDEGEEKLSCAAAPEAYAEALDFSQRRAGLNMDDEGLQTFDAGIVHPWRVDRRPSDPVWRARRRHPFHVA